MTYAELTALDLYPIVQTAEAWELLARNMDGDQARARRDVVGPLTYGWTGKDAEKAIFMLNVFADQMEAARIEAAANAAILREALQLISDAKLELTRIANEAHSQGLTLAADGRLTWTANSDAQNTSYQNAANGFAGRITAALQKAVDADVAAAGALLANVDWQGTKDAPKNDFNAGSLGSDGNADAARVATLIEKMNKPATLSEDEADALRAYLAQNAADVPFSTTLLTRIGPEGLSDASYNLAMSTALTGERNPKDLRVDDFKQTQALLGQTLATASPTLAKDSGWMQRFKEAGEKPRHTPQDAANSGSQNPATVYGYQSLAPLLANGKFDSSFLAQTSDGILAFEKKQGDPTVWTREPQPKYPVSALGDPARNLDPMNSVLDGFKNNPEAATSYFADRSEGAKQEGTKEDPDLTLGRERIDAIMERGGDARADSAGNALVAATTGPPGSPELAQQRVDALTNSVRSFAENGTPEPLRDSVVQMLSGNAESMNAALTQAGEGKGGTVPVPHGPLAEISRGDMTKVLSEVAADPADIETLKKVQEGYTYASLDQINARQDIPADVKARSIENVMESSSKAFGALDSVIAQDIRKAAEEAQANNEASNSRLGMWTGLLIDSASTIGGATAVAANPLIGVPVALGATYANAWVSDYLANAQESSDAAAQISDVYTNGAVYSEEVMAAWARAHPDAGVSEHTAINTAQDGFAVGDHNANNETG
ncbi:hypothetical protein [Yinghuangia soli]|uniref:Uncharacterized protein n=1 Tax=Yinghuangia soli TaxID=2908204 RepID=A0AA41U735_9ACTN|nr:hypothetical protein [Yinghuangia soli]MCF2533657.1 hypothetical protein [Yinghuangia soli]